MTEGTEQYRQTEPFRREDRVPLDPERPIELSIHNPNGEVTVRATDRADALFRHVKHGRPGTHRYEAATLTIEVRDNRIDVRAHLPNDGWSDVAVNLNLGNFNPFKRGSVRRDARGGEVLAEVRGAMAEVGAAISEVGETLGHGGVWFDVEVELPKGIEIGNVRIETASGDVALDAIAGPAVISTASGDATVRRHVGELSLQTGSGDLRIEEAAGLLTARAASGDVRVERSRLGGMTVQTASGDLDLDAILTGTAPYRIDTASGDVRLRLAVPAQRDVEPSASLTFKTASGDARVGGLLRSTGRHAWRAGADGRGPRIEVRTASGDLTADLLARDVEPEPIVGRTGTPPAPPPAPYPSTPSTDVVAPPAPPVGDAVDARPPDEGVGPVDDDAEQAGRLAVLQAVERGEIDVEEALRRLESAPPRESA